MPQINKIMKKKTIKRRKKVAVKVSKRTKNLKAKIKNPVAYFGCMQKCCQKGISPKKIAQIAHECKTNALAINKKVSAEKLKDIKKLGSSFSEFKRNLEEFVKKSVK